jgi:hypothetical protein
VVLSLINANVLFVNLVISQDQNGFVIVFVALQSTQTFDVLDQIITLLAVLFIIAILSQVPKGNCNVIGVLLLTSTIPFRQNNCNTLGSVFVISITLLNIFFEIVIDCIFPLLQSNLGLFNTTQAEITISCTNVFCIYAPIICDHACMMKEFVKDNQNVQVIIVFQLKNIVFPKLCHNIFDTSILLSVYVLFAHIVIHDICS